MVQNNKVLTVSYGTFSCTLEGFDDSFDTMKAIAEYFRDLASDDRYFGAEPPQPDAEMLTRIAQREIDRQVEARTSDGAVHLRATEPPPEVAPQAAVINVPTTPVAVKVEAPEQAVEDEAPEQPVEAEVELPVVEAASAAAVPVANELSEAAADEVSQPPLEGPGSLTVEPAAVEVAPVAEAAPVIETPEPTEQQDDGIDLAAVAAAVAAPEVTELPPVEDIAVDEEADAGDDTVPAADSIAAKLQRIRAVVAQAPRDEEFSEDEHAELFISESAVDIAAAMRLDDEAEQAAKEEESQDQEEIAIALDRIDQRQADTSTETTETNVETEVQVEADATVEAEDETEAELIADVEPKIEVTIEVEPEVEVTAETEVEVEVEATSDDAPEVEEPIAEAADEDDSLFEDLEDGSSNQEADASDEDANILAEVAKHTSPVETTGEEDETKSPLRARIVRVKRADIDRALKSGELEEIVDEALEQAPETSLSDADEADLLRELAAVEAELLASDEVAETPEELEETDNLEAEIDTVEEIAETPATPTSTHPVAETLDSDVSRLMAAADEKLEDPESSSSRETYDHLRAAMAAAQADRAAGGSVGSGVRDEAYREDLASVVRPRRPAAAKTSSRRPTPATRPAPLKLVAEQRIDEAPAKPSGPVRPRRIASSQAEEAEFSDKGRVGGFADYATECGAAELHELLEAAASYMSFVEGRDHFSRPQLMNKVKQLDSAEFNREDGLRSFGQLLREGKIEKTSNGQFTVSGQIGFRPGERAAS